MVLTEYVKVLPTDPEKTPACAHGPGLLFDKVGKQFYACSACRDPSLCSFYVSIDDEKYAKKWAAIKYRHVPETEHSAPGKIVEGSVFCSECSRIFVSKECEHEVQLITEDQSYSPSTFLSQLSAKKSTAQFHFADDSLTFLSNLACQFDKILCLGTPSIFERLTNAAKLCHLADIDRRYEAFFGPRDFTWFNMFNSFAFRESKGVTEFFTAKDQKSDDVNPRDLRNLIVVDPPFGGQLAPLSWTIKKLSEALKFCHVILIFPYFNEAQVKLHFPQLKMCDYAIRYRNQQKMKDSTPARIFTNIPLDLIPLPSDYSFCKKCDRWTHKVNKHCDICETCPSKNHKEYVHCEKCTRCVKASWIHCDKCSKCHLNTDCDLARRKTAVKPPRKKSKKNVEDS